MLALVAALTTADADDIGTNEACIEEPLDIVAADETLASTEPEKAAALGRALVAPADAVEF
jgi:hypothetical protein